MSDTVYNDQELAQLADSVNHQSEFEKSISGDPKSYTVSITDTEAAAAEQKRKIRNMWYTAIIILVVLSTIAYFAMRKKK